MIDLSGVPRGSRRSTIAIALWGLGWIAAIVWVALR